MALFAPHGLGREDPMLSMAFVVYEFMFQLSLIKHVHSYHNLYIQKPLFIDILHQSCQILNRDANFLILNRIKLY